MCIRSGGHRWSLTRSAIELAAFDLSCGGGVGAIGLPATVQTKIAVRAINLGKITDNRAWPVRFC